MFFINFNFDKLLSLDGTLIDYVRKILKAKNRLGNDDIKFFSTIVKLGNFVMGLLFHCSKFYILSTH